MRSCLALPWLGLLAACVVGPDYERPEPVAPVGWSEMADAHAAPAPADLARWWTRLDDPELDSLVGRALAANLDLERAAARVREARAQAGEVRSGLLPDVAARGDASRGRTSENGRAPVPEPTGDLFSAGFDARWELDLFGATRRSLEAARAEVEAVRADREAVLVTLLGEVAAAYVELRGNQRLTEVAQSNVESARKTLALTQTRREAGLADELDVSRAEGLVAGAEAPLAGFRAGARIAIHRLSVLLALPPGELAAELEPGGPIPAVPERVLVGLPSELLTRRPDVRSAERRLCAATARIGAAVAERYPRFSLTGAFGLESGSSAELADAASRAWSLGPTLRWPLFAGGRIEAGIEVADARAEQALLVYRQTVLDALAEVEDALVSTFSEWDHRRSLGAAADAGRRSLALADERYRKGLASFLDVLDAERELHRAELDLVSSEAAATLNAVALYKALGGGWESEG